MAIEPSHTSDRYEYAETVCAACGAPHPAEILTVREMLMGTREEFHYAECQQCGCIELLDIPENLADYYPTDYYAFKPSRVKSWHRSKHLLNRWIVDAYLNNASNPIGKAIAALRRIPTEIEKLACMPIRTSWKILDVGCGAGKQILMMHRFGFQHLDGIDKFLQSDIEYPFGIKIRQCEMADVDDTYDLVMSHHVFEHFLSPSEALTDMKRLTRPGGYIFIAMPNADSYARRHYKNHWVNWDAPRHITIHTPKSITILAEQSGLDVEHIFYDSNILQFAGSEQYIADIPATDPEYRMNGLGSVFDAEQVAEYTEKAEKLNAMGEGDWMCVVLKRP